MKTAIRALIITTAVMLLTPYAQAQLCQGSLGDPIVNITFGSGTNPGSPFSAATTTYQYTSADCPNDGLYTIRTNTLNCFGNTWHTLNSDHTGDPSGYMMVVNASLQPSAFFVDTVRGLCSNTTFEFAVWVANLLVSGQCGGGIEPNLTFTIEKLDGTVLQTYSTGNIPSTATPIWQQVGFYFVTPSGAGTSDVVLRIVNNAGGGCGNDLALDDITFRPCGPTIMANITGSPNTTVSFCAGKAHPVSFNGNVLAGLTTPALQWQENINNGGWHDVPGETGTTLSKDFTTLPSGSYQYRLSAIEAGNLTQCKTMSQVLTVTISPEPVVNITSNAPLCVGATLDLSVTGTDQYQWTGVNGFTATGNMVSIPNVQPAHSGMYYVEASTGTGCTARDSVLIAINLKTVATVDPDSVVICQNKSVQLNSSGGTQYRWLPATGLSDPAIANPIATPDGVTHYMVIVSNGSNPSCYDTAYVVVTVVPAVLVDAGPDKSILIGETTQLNGTVVAASTFNWTPTTGMTDINSLTPKVSPATDIDYILSIPSPTDSVCGKLSDTVHVFVYNDIYIPNAFTPNRDGKNDTWRIPALNAFPVFELSIFNRYGQLIYHLKNNYKPWNGQFNGIDQPNGGYVYLLNVNNGKRVFKGIVMLVK
jgi:gliding motility-associated-like protein